MNIIHLYEYNTEQFTMLVKSPLSPAQKKGTATSLSLRQKMTQQRYESSPSKIDLLLLILKVSTAASAKDPGS